MLISAGVLFSTAGVSCDAAAAGESCPFYASKPTASPSRSRSSEAEIWKSGPMLPASSYVRMRAVVGWVRWGRIT